MADVQKAWAQLLEEAKARYIVKPYIREFTLMSGIVVSVVSEHPCTYDVVARTYTFVSLSFNGVTKLREEAIAMIHIRVDDEEVKS